jgi:hypothetical protein
MSDILLESGPSLLLESGDRLMAEDGIPATTAFGATDPLACTLVIPARADPSLCTSDPDDAVLAALSQADPSLATSEPDDGSLLDQWQL